MIDRAEGFSYPGLPIHAYKDKPGAWEGVTRRILCGQSGVNFEVRYFEVSAGGFSSHEKHAHEHCVVVVRGKGRVRLGGEWSEIGLGDAVHTAPWEAHQFACDGPEPLGFLCVVHRDRDRPVQIDEGGSR